MEKKNIKLLVCNLEIAVSIDVEQESEFRKAAKTVNDEFAKYKAAYSSVEDEKIMAFLLLHLAIKANSQPQSE